ncbi:MAG: hypothetical protein CVT98_02445 [Bacteroidetes bacterium HGW-Bacteroidetes-15]|nr:MAG: hypothetical protein CVT98_02445 [Bacteroidetes bacterium HGW-Bacteroidetes-15]
MLKNYKELKVWQKSYELCLEIYRITAKSPREERYSRRIWKKDNHGLHKDALHKKTNP